MKKQLTQPLTRKESLLRVKSRKHSKNRKKRRKI